MVGVAVVASGVVLVVAAPADPAPGPSRTFPASKTRPPLVVVTFDGDVSVVESTGSMRLFGHVEAPRTASFRAVTAPRGEVFLDVDTSVDGDLSFAGALVGLREGERARTLTLGVVHASTPLLLADGRVAVSRGVAGEARAGEARIDDLTIDAVDPISGAIEPLATYRGYLLFLAGAKGDEIYAYRVGVDGADIVAIDVARDGHPVRVLSANEPPYARDFSVDAIDNQLVYVTRRAGDWAAVTLGLDFTEPGKRGAIAFGGMAMIPRALPFADPSGRPEVLLTRDPERGPELRSGRPLALGPGSAHVADVDLESGWITGTVGPNGARPHVFVANPTTGEVETLPTPERPTFVAGFLRGSR